MVNPFYKSFKIEYNKFWPRGTLIPIIEVSHTVAHLHYGVPDSHCLYICDFIKMVVVKNEKKNIGIV